LNKINKYIKKQHAKNENKNRSGIKIVKTFIFYSRYNEEGIGLVTLYIFFFKFRHRAGKESNKNIKPLAAQNIGLDILYYKLRIISNTGPTLEQAVHSTLKSF